MSFGIKQLPRSTCKGYPYVLKTDVDLNNCGEMSYFNTGKFSLESSDKLNIASLVCDYVIPEMVSKFNEQYC